MSSLFSAIFVGIIIGVFIFFLYQVYKMKKCQNIVEEALKGENAISFLQVSKLSKLCDAYRKSILIEFGGENKTNTPSSFYFSDANVCKDIGLNLHLLDIASGTLVGLGLLGTFFGLTLGIKGFDSNSTEGIQESIQGLLGGMGTAFITSLVGMLSSLLYGFIEKNIKNNFSKSLIDLTDRLDEQYYIDDVELLALKHSKMFEQMTATLVKHLNYTNDEGKDVPIANAIREIRVENAEQSKALKSFSTDLALQLNDGFDEVLSRQMQQKILPLMENVDTTTRAIVEHIDRMAEVVSSPATDMIQVVTDELKQSMATMMSEFKKNISDNASTQIENIASTLGMAVQSMTEFPNNMENISATLQLTIEEVKNAIAEISNTSASSNSRAMQQMQEQITFATTSISNAIAEVKDVMSAITHSSEQSSNDMIAKMTAASEQISNFMNDSVAQMSVSMQDSIKEVLAGVSSSLMDVTNAVNTITQSSEQSSKGIVSELANASESMSLQLKDVMDGIASEIKESMRNVTNDISNKQTDLLALQETTMEETRKLLVVFNNGVAHLEQVNTAISGTMDMFQQAQGQITGCTAHLQTITGDMKLATQIYNKSQQELTSKFDELQTNSQRGVDNVANLLKDSGEVSKEYVEQFETIKGGLISIFTQLQNGLMEYSKTVQDSTQRYLDQYSSSLTNTTNALSSTIQQQNEVVEMLVESLSKYRK